MTPRHGRGRTRQMLPSEHGQAVVEFLGGLPLVIVIGLVCMQLLAVGHASVLAGTAAEAGALALAGGGDATAAARAAVPAWSRARMRVLVAQGEVRIRMRPPSPIRALSRRFEVGARAAVAAR